MAPWSASGERARLLRGGAGDSQRPRRVRENRNRRVARREQSRQAAPGAPDRPRRARAGGANRHDLGACGLELAAKTAVVRERESLADVRS
jgi:hypothetical protein